MNRMLLLVTCFVFLGAGIVLAGPSEEYTFEIGTELYHLTYEEPDLMEDKGLFGSVLGSFTYHDELMLKGECRFGYGQVDYTSEGTGSMDGISYYVIELRGLGGYDFAAPEVFTFTRNNR